MQTMCQLARRSRRAGWLIERAPWLRSRVLHRRAADAAALRRRLPALSTEQASGGTAFHQLQETGSSMTVCDGPVCICGLSDDRCVCGCVVPEAAPIADFLPSAAKAAAMAVELPPPPAEPTVGPPVKRTAFSSRYELQRGELREIDSEAQLEAVAAEEIAMQRKRKRWKPPAPEDLAEEELEVVGAICEMELLGQL
ncbi:hypothetical protein EMIHUDRAFT_260038, partial [Emiliania huxleyi CCMP1516]|uniref:Cysteine/serine-rich nuclear protein N-terminal domain-containing protein n=2 Tax=Emiliania huxleyi TaxID=2903 RepID=A0A0D3KYE7_EMIH1